MKTIHKPRIRGLLVLSFALWVCLPLSATNAQTAAPSPVLAVVNGRPVTENDVRATDADGFTALDREYRRTVRELTEKKLDQLVEDRLVEAEAAARRITREALLAQIKAAPVTDADINAFYEQNKATFPARLSREQVSPQIKGYLEQQRAGAARQDFFNQLAVKYKVERRLDPFRVDVAAIGPARGPANAPVTIIVFSDFQSPLDSRFAATLQQARVKYADRIRVVFRQFPLPMHMHAQKAGEASLCAADQGKFWEIHDSLFADQRALSVDDLKVKASQLRLNAALFNSCLDSNKHARTVQTDIMDGAKAGVSGTPTMFINGRLIGGAVPLDQIAPVIDDELRRKGLR